MLYNCLAAVAGDASFCSKTFISVSQDVVVLAVIRLFFLLFHLLSPERIILKYVGEFVRNCMVSILMRNVDYILGINMEFFYQGYF